MYTVALGERDFEFGLPSPSGRRAGDEGSARDVAPTLAAGVEYNNEEGLLGRLAMVTTSKVSSAVLPLESGDRLTRHEFEVRYAAMPDLKKAELVEGVVYLASPVRVVKHSKPHSALNTWLGVYWTLTPGVMVCDNTTVRLDTDNEPQPDILLRIDENKGGQSRISSDDYIEGAPELVVEIAGSSASYDLYDKKTVYRRNGVQEYIVWNAGEQAIVWFSLESGKYIKSAPDELGVIRSRVFPGLWLNVNAFVEGDLMRVYETLQMGLSDPSHQEFVSKLAGASV